MKKKSNTLPIEFKLSQLIRPKNNVIIFSDTDAFVFFSSQEIKETIFISIIGVDKS